MDKRELFAKMKLCGAMAIYGSIGIFVKFLTLPSGFLVFLRASIGALFLLPFVIFGKNKFNFSSTYILSASGEFSQICCSVGIKDANGTLLCDANVTHAGQTVIFNLASYPTYSYLEIVCKRNNNAALSGTAYFQLEQGAVATEYERYKGTDYIGIFENVSSLYPTTALVTNTEGVIVHAKYNKDTNKVIAALLSLVQGGGGRISYIDLPSAKWQGSASPYSQVVSITGITENSKVDINPSIEQLAIFHTKDIAFVAENEDGVVTVYCIGQKPTADYQMQITITEVLANG